MPSEFKNEPLTDFSNPGNREAQAGAIRSVEASFGATYPLILGGQEVTVCETFESINPSTGEQISRESNRTSKASISASFAAMADSMGASRRLTTAGPNRLGSGS